MRELGARVEAVCLSVEGIRVAKTPVADAFLGPHGFVGDRHEAEFRRNPYNGKPIPNKRQWTAVSTKDIEALCAELAVRPFSIGALGENLRLSGIEELSRVPEGSEIEFPSGARLLVTGPNQPCLNAARELARAYGSSLEQTFVKMAYGRRGLLGIVLAVGVVRPGDMVRLLVMEAEGLQLKLGT